MKRSGFLACRWAPLLAVALFGCNPSEQRIPVSRALPVDEEKGVVLASGRDEAVEAADKDEFATRPSDYDRKWAIVVGIDSYVGGESGLPPLSHARNDAREFRSILIEEFGYKDEYVYYLADHEATAAAIRAAFQEWLKPRAVRKDDSALVFFAGHGEVVETSKEGYLAAVDSARSDYDTCMSVGWIVEQLKALPCRHKLVILDSCYSGALFQKERSVNVAGRTVPGAETGGRSMRVRGNGEVIRGTTGFSYYLTRPAFLGMSAGRLTPVADGFGEDRHSLFTWALLHVLRLRAYSRRDDHVFTFRQLAAQVEGLVTSAPGSQQVPDWGYLDKGDGDFVFRPTVSRVTQIHFDSPAGMEIAWMADDGSYSATQLTAPAKYDFDQGWLYRLKLSSIIGHPDEELYATLKVVAPPLPEGQMENHALSIRFADEDFDNAMAGHPVLKVLFLTAPEYRELSLASVEGSEYQTISSLELDPGIDVMLEAAMRGTVVAVVHLGDRDWELNQDTGAAKLSQESDTGRKGPNVRPRRIPMTVFNEEQRFVLRHRKLHIHVSEAIVEALSLEGAGRAADAMQLLKRASDAVRLSRGIDPEISDRLIVSIMANLREAMRKTGGPHYRQLQRAKDVLSEPSAADFIEAPLDDVLAALSHLHGVRIEADQRALDVVGISIDVPIDLTIEMGRSTLRSCLDRLCRELDLVYHPTPEGLRVTTPEEDEISLVRVNYPIADLMHDNRVGEPEELKRMIKQQVEPWTWDSDGFGVIDYVDSTMMLVVRQSWSVHLLIDDFLTDIRLGHHVIEP